MFSSSQSSFSQLSQSNDAAPSSAKRVQELVPVTVKEISEAASNAADEKFSFLSEGIDTVNVTLVGRVCEKTGRVTDVGFVLDDGTGRIDCKRWVTDDFDTQQMEEIQDEMYVRVVGNLKNIKGTRQIAVFSARPVKNFDEITFHFIECIHFYLQKSKLRGGAPALSQPAESSQRTLVSSESNGHKKLSPNEMPSQFNIDGTKDNNQLILDYLQQPLISERAEGVHRDELSKQLKLPVEKIMETIRSLEDEGLIYSTIDEFHFKST